MRLVLDGAVVYSGSFRAGFDVLFPVAPGDHALATAIEMGIVARRRVYNVNVPAGQTAEMLIAYSRLWGNFKKECVLTLRSLACSNAPTPSASGGSTDEDTWSLGQGQSNGRPLIMRVRTPLATPVPNPAYATRFTVTWTYGTSGVDGLPASAVLDDLANFEIRLLRAFERNRLAIAVAVATTGGTREWMFYLSNPDQAQAHATFLAEFGGDARRYPVALATVADPGWLEYSGILDKFGRR